MQYKHSSHYIVVIAARGPTNLNAGVTRAYGLLTSQHDVVGAEGDVRTPVTPVNSYRIVVRSCICLKYLRDMTRVLTCINR